MNFEVAVLNCNLSGQDGSSDKCTVEEATLSILANIRSLDRSKTNLTASCTLKETWTSFVLRMLRELLSELKRTPSRVMPISQVVPSRVVTMSRKRDDGIPTVALYGALGSTKVSTSSQQSISIIDTETRPIRSESNNMLNGQGTYLSPLFRLD